MYSNALSNYAEGKFNDMIKGALNKLFGGDIDQTQPLQAQIAAMQASIDALCINNGTGKLTDSFLFTHGDTWRVYFLNDICATGFLELTSADSGGYLYIKVTSKFYNNGGGTIIKQNMPVRSEINFATQLGLYYPTGEGKTNIYCTYNGIRSNYNNQQGGAYNGIVGTESHFGNAHSVKVVKLS